MATCAAHVAVAQNLHQQRRPLTPSSSSDATAQRIPGLSSSAALCKAGRLGSISISSTKCRASRQRSLQISIFNPSRVVSCSASAAPAPGWGNDLSSQSGVESEVQRQHEQQPTSMSAVVADLVRRCTAAWPTVAKVLPRVMVSLLIIILPILLRPSSSLAHGGIGHLHGAEAAAAAADQSVAMQVMRYGWMGLVAGGLHTLTGPDHLAALAPLTIGKTRMESAAIGALWGLGHDAGQVLFAVLFVLLKEKLHLDMLRVWGQRIVALTLMAIGALGIHEARLAEVEGLGHHHHHHHHHDHHDHSHDHDELVPAVAGGSTAPQAKRKNSFTVATFMTGIVHGLQPDALLVVLPALAMPSRVAGASFLATFLLGTVVAMGSYTAFIGSCSDALRDRVPGMTKKLSWIAAFLALALGGGMLLGEVFGFQVL